MRVVLASNNPGKIREMRELVKDFHIELIPQAELGVDEIEETGLTFIENALIKARHACKQTGLPAIADDSGLSVTALQGAPGIYSARYAGIKATSLENINKLLVDLAAVPDDKRDAAFHCVLVYMSHDKDPKPLVCEGRWSGTILRTPLGTGGFGYDPIFYLPREKMTSAQLPADIKNKVSHRATALASLIKLLPGKL